MLNSLLMFQPKVDLSAYFPRHLLKVCLIKPSVISTSFHDQ